MSGTRVLAMAGLLFGLSLAVWASPAAAQRADDMKNSQNPCVGDAQRLCSAEIPDRAKVASCLFKNKRQLTPACRAEIGGGKSTTTRKGRHRRHARHHRRHRR